MTKTKALKPNSETVQQGSLIGAAGVHPLAFAILGLCSGLLLQSQLTWAAPDPKPIMAQHEDRRKIDDIQSTATLTTGGGGNPERMKGFTWWKKLQGDKVHFNTLTRFQLPAEIRGEGILFLEREKDNEVLMYLPAFKKIRRVETQQQSGSFMGSEFSYSDIATPHLEDYTYKYLREEACPEGTGAAGVKCHVIESTPINAEIKERTGYSKLESWIRQDNQMSVKGQYYNAEGELFKKMSATALQNVDPAKNKWMAMKVRIDNVKNGKFTLLDFSQVKVNKGIADAIFTQQNLSRAQ